GPTGAAAGGGMTVRLRCRRIAVLGLSVLGGCAAPSAAPPTPSPAAAPPVVTVTTAPETTAQGERSVALPNVSPRTEGGSAAPTPGGPASTAPAQGQTAQGPTTQVPPGRPITPPARAGRQIVLNFDNADIEAVIQAASEIAGFNYTIGPGVAGK